MGMRSIRNTIGVFSCLVFLSCQNDIKTEEQPKDDSGQISEVGMDTNEISLVELKENYSLDTELDDCLTIDISDFNSFLGLEYGIQEHEVLQDKRLGDFSGGAYGDDEKVFIYQYNTIPTAPIELWIDTESGKVITVFLELLSKDKGYKKDLELVAENYALERCFKPLFGLTADGIQQKLGEPAEDAVSNDGVRLLAYDSNLNDISVSFKIYPDQDNTCTSIAVHWFYPED